MDYNGKKVLVCGMARSGIAAAELLCEKGAVVTLQDLKEKEKLGDMSLLEKKGIVIYAGKNPDDIILEQDLIVLSPGIACDLPFVKKAEENNIPLWSEVELAYTMTPCPVIAITGTNGKTTTTTLVGELLKAQYPNTAVVGNIGLPYSQKVKSLTKEDWVVAEISSFQMEKAHTFHPKISAVLNITPDHLNRHKTMEVYIAMKQKVWQNQTKQDYCILNREDAVCRAMAEKTKANVFFFSSQRVLEEGIYLENGFVKLSWQGIRETLFHVDELKLLGMHNYENVMAACAIAVCANVALEKIIKITKQFPGVAHRIEYVATINDVEYYNDSKGTNTDAAIRAILAMKRPIILIGGGYDKGVSFKEWVKLFPGRVKEAVLIGVTADQIEKEAKEVGFDAVSKCETFQEAVTLCYQKAQPGDCVLLSPACASWGMFDNYEQRGDLFKKLVKAYL